MFISFLKVMIFLILLASCVSTPKIDQAKIKLFDDTISGSVSLKKGLERLCLEKSDWACDKISKQEVRVNPSLSIVQGATDASSIQINVLLSKNDQFKFLLFNSVDQNFVTPTAIEKIGREGSEWIVYQLRFTKLKKDLKYEFEVLDSTKNFLLLDKRYVSTFSPRTKNIRFAVASCLSDEFSDLQKSMWENLNRQHPELIFLIGDNVYVDNNQQGGKVEVKNPLWIWQRYVESRLSLDLYKFQNLVPVYAVWDDHDYGKNDSDKSFVFKNESAEIFRSFFSLKNNDILKQSGQGVSYSLSLLGQSFLFLDNRFFRSEPNTSANKETHFGPNQEKWVFDFLDQARTQPTWIISGDQFFGGYHSFESYEGRHLSSFKKFLNYMRGKKSKVVFLSGDRHLAEIMKVKDIGYETYEITTSGIHAKLFSDAFEKDKNPRRIGGFGGEANFAIIESHVLKNNKDLMVNVGLFGRGTEPKQTFNLNIH